MRLSDTTVQSRPGRTLPRAGTLSLACFSAYVLACAFSAGCGGGRAAGLERQMAWVSSHPNAPQPVIKAVLGKKLQEGVGMATDAVIASWGQPHEKLDLGGGDARWVYRKRQLRNTGRVTIVYTLIFNRGYLTRVLQEERR